VSHIKENHAPKFVETNSIVMKVEQNYTGCIAAISKTDVPKTAYVCPSTLL
jgi:hypothetical protein